MPDAYEIRTMTRGEIDLAVEWALDEGWNPGLHDADAFHAADPEGFLVGLLHGEPVASISAVKYGTSYGFLGFYIVRKDLRGRGYGLRIWDAAMSRLAGRTLGLDGVIDQQSNHEKSGFVLAHNNVRYEGTGGGDPPNDEDIADLATVGFEAVNGYDRDFFPEDRSAFLRAWISQPDASGLGLVRDGELTGYGVLRRCHSGSKIGPLFADDIDTAVRLFDALRSRSAKGEPLFLDVPATNAPAVELAERNEMKPVFETVRMYLGAEPNLPRERTYGITTFELG